MEHEREMSKEEIREKLREMTDPATGGIGGLMASLSSPLIGAYVQVQQARRVLEEEDLWPPVHKLAVEAELGDAQQSADSAEADLEELLVETLFMQQYCQCANCRMEKAGLN